MSSLDYVQGLITVDKYEEFSYLQCFTSEKDEIDTHLFKKNRKKMG